MWLGQLVTRHLGAYQSFFHWQASSIRQVCDSALIDISSTWQLLGPFQIGTRGMRFTGSTDWQSVLMLRDRGNMGR